MKFVNHSEFTCKTGLQAEPNINKLYVHMHTLAPSSGSRQHYTLLKGML